MLENAYKSLLRFASRLIDHYQMEKGDGTSLSEGGGKGSAFLSKETSF